MWSPFTTDHHGLSISLLETYDTGTPYGALGLVDTRASARRRG
jgi:hypothetical protein